MGDLSNLNNPTKSMSPWYFEVLPNDPQNYARDYALFTVMCYINARYYYNKAITSTMYMNLLCPNTFQDKLQWIFGYSKSSLYKNDLFLPANNPYQICVYLNLFPI